MGNNSRLKIKSINDVITNSSDEAYIVKNSGDSKTIEELFGKFMAKHHRDEWYSLGDYFRWPCMQPDRYKDLSDGSVLVDWTVMCNLGDAQGYLEDCFGKENILDADNCDERFQGLWD